MSLKNKAKSMNSGQGIMFMEGREKGNVKSLNGKIVEVVDYNFINGDSGKYLVFIIRQDTKNFYFGASVMTENFLSFTPEDKEEIQMQGIPIMLEDKKNRKGTRTYQNCIFYPGEEEVAEWIPTDDDIPF